MQDLSQRNEKNVKRGRKRSLEITISPEKENHQMLSACGCKQKKCDMKIKEEERKQLYLAYWSMGYNERRHWLYSHMQILDVNRRYTAAGP